VNNRNRTKKTAKKVSKKPANPISIKKPKRLIEKEKMTEEEKLQDMLG